MKAESSSAGEIRLARLPAVAVRALIRLYQLTLSPFIGNQCRFHPTCSNYALAAVDAHGALKGSWMALRRLGRCHPFNPGGFDPVPGCEANGTDPNRRYNQVSGSGPGAKEI